MPALDACYPILWTGLLRMDLCKLHTNISLVRSSTYDEATPEALSEGSGGIAARQVEDCACPD